MEKAMTEKKAAPLTTPMVHLGPEVLRSDILVPYVVIAQGTSESVKERKAQLGDIVRSTSLEKLGDPDKPLDIVFLHYPRANWIIEAKEGKSDRFQYVRQEVRNASNETDSWSYWCDTDGNEVAEGTKGAVEYRRVKQLLVFAILPQDIEASQAEMAKVEQGELPDPTKALTPVLLSFRAFSYKAGKEVCTFFAQAESMKVPMWKYSLSVGCTLEKNDDGSFYIWKVDRTQAKPVKQDYWPVVENWVKLVGQGGLRTDETAEGEGYQAPASGVTQAGKTEVC